MRKTLIFVVTGAVILLTGCSYQVSIDEQADQLATNQNSNQQAAEENQNTDRSIDPYEDWQTYTNTEYGFEIKYPAKYKTVVDNYGWPNSIVHFIEKEPGAQAYRAAISVWDNQNDYTNSTAYSAMKFTTHNVGNKYIVISYYATDNEIGLINEWQEITDTFKSIQ